MAAEKERADAKAAMEAAQAAAEKKVKEAEAAAAAVKAEQEKRCAGLLLLALAECRSQPSSQSLCRACAEPPRSIELGPQNQGR